MTTTEAHPAPTPDDGAGSAAGGVPAEAEDVAAAAEAEAETAGSGAAGAATTTGEDGAAGSSGHRGLAYNPALDGIRGLAVGAVLLFHGGFTWARGGYLGVSTFFTLSGFLITSLLLAEHGRTGRVGLTAFWARRLRRLLPASAVTLVALVVSMVLVEGLWGPEVPGDVVAAALQVANWHFLWEDRSYGELFAAPSPVLHFWSLAIEEQFYWVFPLLTAGVLGVARGSRRVFAGVLVVLLGVSAGLTLLWRDEPDTVYYATPVRMGEILVGCLLAVAVAGGLVARLPRWARALAGVAGAVALAGSAWAWANVEQSSEVLTRGGLLVYAVASGALVLAACVPGPLRRALGFEPLRLLGLVSYGVYLFHWPLFLVVTPQRLDDWFGWRPDPTGWPLFLARVVPTLVVAAGSYVVLEQPIRRGRWPRARVRAEHVTRGFRFGVPAPLWALGSVAVVVAAALAVPDEAASPGEDQFEQATDQLAGLDDEALAAAEAQLEQRRSEMPQGAVDVMFFGDSAALTVAAGVGEWGLQSKRLLLVGDGATTQVGCGVGRGGERRQFGASSEVPDGCPDWDVDWPREVDERPGVQVGVVLTGSWDVMDRRIPGDAEWRGLGDPVYDDWMRAEIAGATDTLLAKGLTVVWLTTPPLDFGRAIVPRPEPDPPDILERIDRLNELIREVVAERPGAAVVDFGAEFAGMSQAENDRLRPDGVHVELTNSLEVAQWLAPEILAAAGDAEDAAEVAAQVSGN